MKLVFFPQNVSCFSPRFRDKQGTVESLWIKPTELSFGTDDEVSDESEIWSEYGDEVRALF